MTEHPNRGTSLGVAWHVRTRIPVCGACLTWACAIEEDNRAAYFARVHREAS